MRPWKVAQDAAELFFRPITDPVWRPRFLIGMAGALLALLIVQQLTD